MGPVTVARLLSIFLHNWNLSQSLEEEGGFLDKSGNREGFAEVHNRWESRLCLDKEKKYPHTLWNPGTRHMKEYNSFQEGRWINDLQHAEGQWKPTYTPPEAKTSIQEKKTQLRGWDTVFSCVVESHA